MDRLCSLLYIVFILTVFNVVLCVCALISELPIFDRIAAWIEKKMMK